VQIRRCWRHGDGEFALYGRQAPQWRCKRCVAEAVTRRHQKVRRLLVKRAGGKCVVCGYDRCIINLHFHHVDPSLKSFNMTMASGKSATAYLAEARKCVLVCANCRGEIEAGLIESPPAQDMGFGFPGLSGHGEGGKDVPAAQLRLNLGEVLENRVEPVFVLSDHEAEPDRAER
jgi:hypothetical protein